MCDEFHFCQPPLPFCQKTQPGPQYRSDTHSSVILFAFGQWSEQCSIYFITGLSWLWMVGDKNSIELRGKHCCKMWLWLLEKIFFHSSSCLGEIGWFMWKFLYCADSLIMLCQPLLPDQNLGPHTDGATKQNSNAVSGVLTGPLLHAWHLYWPWLVLIAMGSKEEEKNACFAWSCISHTRFCWLMPLFQNMKWRMSWI